MSFNQNITLFAKGQQESTDNYNDFGYFNDGTVWYETTPVYTARVTAYAAATGITDYTILDPLNIFDLGLTYYGLDTIMKAIYPMVTDKTSQSDMATQMKYNFMNPLDTNPAFRLNWVGGWVYSRTGALPNGTNAYADTNLIPSTALSLNNSHLSLYNRTNATSFFNATKIDGTGANTAMSIVVTTAEYGGRFMDDSYNVFSSPNSLGFYIGNRTSGTQKKYYKNGVGGTFNVNSLVLPDRPLTISAIFGNGYTVYSSGQCAFSSIGNGLTDFQADIFSTLVNNLQKALNRAVY